MELDNTVKVVDEQTKVNEEEKEGIEVKEYRNLFVLSGAFLAVFTGFFSIQNLETSLNEEEGLGRISLLCIYVFYILGGIVSPTVINAFGEKRTIVISFLCYLMYTGANFYPTFATLIPASVFTGFAAGLLWPAQSIYLTKIAYSYAEKTAIDVHTALSKFNGVFIGMYESTQIVGNLISSLVLRQGTYDNSTINTDFCGRHDCPIEANTKTIHAPETKLVYILLGIYLICELVGVFLTACFLQELPKPFTKNRGEICRSPQACGKGMLDLNLLMLVPLFVFMAMIQGILWTDFTKAYISCPFGIQRIGFVMATYGASTTLSALGFSRITQYTGRYFMFGLAGIMNAGLLVTLYLWIPDEDHLGLIFVVAFLYGLPEGILQTESNALTALLFPDKKNAAFAVNQTWKAIGFTVTFAYGNFLCVSTKLIVTSVMLISSTVLYCILEVRVKRSSGQAQISISR